MNFILTLIAAPGSGALSQAIVNTCLARVQSGTDQDRLKATWLADQEACEVTDICLEDRASHSFLDSVKSEVGSRPVDIHLLPASRGPRTKALLVADMESTIIQEELIDELAAQLGLGNEIAEITARAMRGELDFAEALQARVAQFAGVSHQQLDALYAHHVTLMPGARALIQTMKAHGAQTALVSGGFLLFAERIADRLGFDAVHANTLAFQGDALTGTVNAPILDRAAKAETLRKLVREQSLDIEHTLAVGDGANDLDMLATAGLGVAFRAKPVVAQKADTSVQHGDLTSLLYLQGIAKNNFVSD